jgi:hypothetical protein
MYVGACSAMRASAHRRSTGLSLDHLYDWDTLDASLGDDPPKRRHLPDPKADVEPDCDHDDAEQERDAPAPNQELVAGDAAEYEHRCWPEAIRRGHRAAATK